MTEKITAITILVEKSAFDDDSRLTDRGVVKIELLEASIPEPVLTFVKERLKTNG